MEPLGASVKPPVLTGDNPTTNGRHWPKRVYQPLDSRWVNVEKKEPEKIPDEFVQKEHEIAQQPSLPKLGILTHTALESPAIRFIIVLSKDIHGRIDIACIGDTSLTVKRLDTTGSFTTLWETHSIKSVIRNAKMFGDYKLVLALEDDDLIFVQLEGVAEGFEPIFTRYEVRMRKLAGLRLGAKMANSPGCRFTAVACFSDMIVILEANKGSQSDVPNEGPNYLPQCVNRSKIVQLRGYIVLMDFLAPPENDAYLVLLAVVTCNKGECRLQLLQWVDAPAAPWEIDETHHGTDGYRLPSSVGFPTLLIPLAASDTAELLLVCENSIVRIKGLLDGDFKAMIVSLDLRELRPQPMHMLTPNSYAPLWVTWFRLYTSPHHFMLVREDGVHMRIISGLPLTNSISTSYPPRTSIVLPVAIKIPDSSDYASFVLFVAENCSCQVRKVVDEVGDKSGYQPVFAFPNWSPLNDFVCTSSQPLKLSKTNTRPNLKTTFPNQDVAAVQPTRAIAYGASGLGNQGHVSKLGGEIEALMRFKLTGFEKVTGIWAVPNRILVSFADRSVLLRRTEDEGEWESVPEERTWLDLTSRTFHASFDCDVPFQVSSNGLTMHPEPALSYNSPQQAYRIPQADLHESVVAAASHNNYLCVLRSSPEDGCLLDICSLDNDAMLENRLTLLHHNYELKSSRNIAMAQVESTLVIAVSYASAVHPDDSGEAEDSPAGSICLLVQDTDTQGPGSELESSPNFTSMVLRPWNIPGIEDSISIAFLNMDDNPQNFVVVSGHRDGTLVAWECIMTLDEIGSHTKPFHKKLGNGEVQVLADPSNAVTALISCDGLVYRLTSSQSSRYPQLTKVALPASKYANNSGVPAKTRICNYGKDFLIHRGSKIIGFKLRQEQNGFLKLCQSRFSIYPTASLGFLGPATCILDPAKFGGIITAGTKLQEDCKLVPLLVACRPDGSRLHGLVAWQQLPKEKSQTITCMIEIPTPPNWEPPNWKGKTCTRLLVGTSRGSLILIDVEFGQPARTPVRMNFHEPIHALLSRPGRPDLVYVCCGTDLFLVGLSEDALEHDDARIMASIELPSRGVAMSSLGPEVTKNGALSVLTAEHSVISFTFGDMDEREHSNDNVQHVSIVDKTARDGLDIFTMLDPKIGGNIVLVTDKDCTITGLYPPSGLTFGIPVAYRKLFSAELSSSIKKLCVAEAAPLWDSQADLSVVRNYEKSIVRVSTDKSFKYPTLLGSGVHGSLHQIRVLKEPLMQLLLFLQHFALQVPEMHSVPRKGQDNENKKQTEYRMPEKVLAEIDGDLLKLWLVNRDLEEKLHNWSGGSSSCVLGPIHAFCTAVLTWKPELMAGLVEICGVNEQGELQLYEDVYEDLLHEHVKEVYELLEYLFRPLF